MIIGGKCVSMVVMVNVVIMTVFKSHEPTLDHMCTQSVCYSLYDCHCKQQLFLSAALIDCNKDVLCFL
jgi:hypothetical protein